MPTPDAGGTAPQAMPPIQGSLPWGGMGGGANAFQGLQGTPQQAMANLGTNYANAYQSSLAMNQQNYQNILAGYQQTQAQQQSAFGNINDQFHNLYGAVNKTLTGADQAAQQQIRDLYAQQQGSATQSLTNAGLGNTTVTSAVGRGLTADESKAQVNLANQFAQLRAGYKSQIGQASLGFDQQAAMANTGLAQNQLGWMNSVNAGYPNAGMYAQLAQQYGMFDQANQDRSLMKDQFNQQMALQKQALMMPHPGGGGGAPGLGYPSPGMHQFPGDNSVHAPGMGGGESRFFNPAAGSMGGMGSPYFGYDQGTPDPFMGSIYDAGSAIAGGAGGGGEFNPELGGPGGGFGGTGQAEMMGGFGGGFDPSMYDPANFGG